MPRPVPEGDRHARGDGVLATRVGWEGLITVAGEGGRDVVAGSRVAFGAVGHLIVDADTTHRWLFEGSLKLGLPLLLTTPFLLGTVVWAVLAWAGRW